MNSVSLLLDPLLQISGDSLVCYKVLELTHTHIDRYVALLRAEHTVRQSRQHRFSVLSLISILSISISIRTPCSVIVISISISVSVVLVLL